METLIYQTKQIRELEKLAQQRFGISEEVMMQRAGKAASEYLLQRWPKAKKIGVICGSGNNGGDGYVLASALHKRGLQVQLWQVGDVKKSQTAAFHAFELCQQAGIFMQAFKPDLHLNSSVDVLVDALLGIGLKGALQGDALLAVQAMNAANRPILSMDIPSGVDADSGMVQGGTAVKATATITFIGLKLGLLTGEGVGYVGEWYCNDLQLPSECYHLVKCAAEKIDVKQFIQYLAPRPRFYHKGHCGHVLVIGGDDGYSGAVCLAAEAALHVGAGLVSVATRKENAHGLNAVRPEIMCHGVNTAAELLPLLERATTVVIGPGLGKTNWAKELLQAAIDSQLPLVVDADALNNLAENPLQLNHWVLTPHPGEAARLLKTTTDVIQKDRLGAVMKLQKLFGGVCLLKGAGTLIAAHDSIPALCHAGNPGMATAGMGDVLSGVIAGLIAQGIPAGIAAKLGVCLHAEAGDLAAKEGMRGMIASDLFVPLRKLVNPYEI